MQPRFENRSGNRAYRLLESPRFRMAYDFLALRAASGEVPAELEAWWRAFQSADAEARTGHAAARHRRRASAAAGAGKQGPGGAPAPDAASRRDRRLRRASAPNLERAAPPGPRSPSSELAALPHTRVVKNSSLYRTGAVGYADQPDFVNAVAQLETGLPAERLLAELQEIEARHGRERSFRNAPRTLDLDILLFGDAVLDLRAPDSCRTRACTSGRSC